MNKTMETAKIDEFFAEITAYEEAGRQTEALNLAEKVAQAAPQMAQAQNMAGLQAFHRGDYAKAKGYLEKAIGLAPSLPAYPRNLGLVYHALGQLDEALAMARQALTLAPDEPSLYFNQALILYDSLAIEDGLRVVNHALALNPDYAEARFLKAELHLLAGQLCEGWDNYECRFDLEQGKPMLPQTGHKQWNGEKLKPGRLLLVADQGFGDCIQFARYIPWVTRRAPKPILAASDELLPLLGQLKGLGRMVRRWGEVGDYDAYIPLSGLPRLAGTTLETIPAACPYLQPDPRKVTFWRQRLEVLLPAGLKRVGLVWAGRPTHKKDKKRSIKLEEFAPLLAREDIALVSLQKGERIGDVGMSFSVAPLLNLGPMIRDFNDTLAILQCLNHLVSVDTSVAHLAGASGVATSLLLPYAPDWRWLLDRRDSPWYPSFRLFRQKRPGAWEDVIAQVNASL